MSMTLIEILELHIAYRVGDCLNLNCVGRHLLAADAITAPLGVRGLAATGRRTISSNSTRYS
jgi:hypothetical protein